MELRMSLLLKFPYSKLSAKYQDSGVYVCKRSVLNLLKEKTHIESLRREFIPWLCKMQYQREKRARYGKSLEATMKGIQDTAIRHSTKHDQQDKHLGRHEAGLHFASSPGFPDLVQDEESSSCPNLGIGLVLHRSNTGFAARITTLSAYSETNRTFLSQLLPFASTEKQTAEQKIQISPDSMVGDSTKIEERTTIKKCVIGKHCTIGKMVRLVGCVVLDHCVIGDGYKRLSLPFLLHKLREF
jgi:translation initiation factor eIF-2B subunit gamma